MLGPRQFGLAYLLLETFWIALALASIRAILTLPEEYHKIAPLLLLICLIVIGVAIGVRLSAW